jgi:hypothetical protein
MEGKEIEIDEDELAKKFIRYTTKNPFFVRSIKMFLERNCSKFNSDEEHKLEYTALFKEYEDLVDRSIDLFISKTPGCTEATLMKALEREEHMAFVSALTAKASYEDFVTAVILFLGKWYFPPCTFLTLMFFLRNCAYR